MTDAKNPDQKRDRGQLRIDQQECKGCGLCVEACPPKVIAMSEGLNHYGYQTALYAGTGCTGCGICFMVCPEPGAITVYRLVSERGKTRDSHRFQDETTERMGQPGSEGASACASN